MSDPLHIYACLAYFAGRIISGKHISSLYDYSRAEEINTLNSCEAGNFRDFGFITWSHMSLSGSNRYRYSCSSGNFIEITVRGNTFIGYIRNLETHVLGNVRGDNVHIFDQKQAARFNYRMIGNPSGEDMPASPGLDEYSRVRGTRQLG